MENTFIETPAVKEFKKSSVGDLVRQELGIKGFQDVEIILYNIKSMIDEMILTVNNYSVPKELSNMIYVFINQFNEFANRIMTYNVDSDSGFNQRNSILEDIRGWNEQIYRGYDNNRYINNFLQVYNSLKLYDLISLQKDKTRIDQLKRELEESKTKAKEIISLLQVKAAGESVEDYARIYQEQSKVHSYFNFSIKPLKLKLGSAEKWLFMSILLIIGFVIFAFKINDIIPIDFSLTPSNVTLEFVTRLLLISFSIYVISFTLKQYNVQKHLHTLNRHRQNTLNSYKLFIESLDANDMSTRNALMMEVAKAIYESGQSGFISSKDGSDSSPSIIELTRFVGSKSS